MKNIVEVKGIKIGEGQPKICIPVVARNIEEIKKQGRSVMFTPADIIEWRIDYLMNVTDIAYVLTAMKKLKECIEGKPILVTFRTFKEGGKCKITVEQYTAIYMAVIESGLADMIDIEFFLGEKIIQPLMERAGEKGVKVILSNHDFEKTPPAKEIISRLMSMKALGADIAKVAVMPRDSGDVLTLLSAAEHMKHIENPIPIVTISMAATGTISRIAGEIFGSAITFASAGNNSAPGQIDADILDRITSMIHKELVDEAYKNAHIKQNYKSPKNPNKSSNRRAKGAGKNKHKGKKNIILVGFMGTGKTTVSKIISHKTGMSVKEIDEMIEENAGMRITEIFNQFGEEYFRDVETQQVKVLSNSKGVIVSCGGGTVMRQQNVDYLKSTGTIILLRATADTVYERVKRGGNKRPLLNKYMSRGYISTLMKKRSETYLSVADYVIDVDDKSSEDIAEMIIDIMDIK